MSFKSLLDLVEIRTKVASMFPLITGVLYTYTRYEKFNILTFILFFISLFCIDLATTTINNFMDVKKHNGNSEKSYGFSEYVIFTIIAILLLLGALFGIFTVAKTNLLVLLLGAMSFAIGILYSFGPVPIYRTPFGEFFSGIFMGGVILFLTIYTQIFNLDYITFAVNNSQITLSFNWIELSGILLLALPMICFISNIMLANNTCDLEEDIENDRYTLPYFIGKKNAVILFVTLNILSFVFIILAVILNFLPIWSLIVLLSIVPISKNIKKYIKLQDKRVTFKYSVENFSIFSTLLVLSLIVDIFIKI